MSHQYIGETTWERREIGLLKERIAELEAELAARREVDAEARRLNAAIVPEATGISVFGLLPLRPIARYPDYPALAAALRGVK